MVARLVAQVPAIERLPAHREAIDWRVHVVRKAQPNAMAAPGGQIVVFTGALRHMLRPRPAFSHARRAPARQHPSQAAGSRGAARRADGPGAER